MVVVKIKCNNRYEKGFEKKFKVLCKWEMIIFCFKVFLFKGNVF